MDDILQFVGMSRLRMDERERVIELAERHYPKLKRAVKNIAQVIVHVKLHKVAGSRRKYSLHVKLVAPGHVYESNKHHGYDMTKVCLQAFDALIHEIEHRHH